MAEDKGPTAALVSTGAPSGVDGALSVRQNTDIGVLFRRFVCSRKPKTLDVAGCEADSEKRLGRMQRLGKELGAQRECTQILEHGDGADGDGQSTM